MNEYHLVCFSEYRKVVRLYGPFASKEESIHTATHLETLPGEYFKCVSRFEIEALRKSLSRVAQD